LMAGAGRSCQPLALASVAVPWRDCSRTGARRSPSAIFTQTSSKRKSIVTARA
jgi:hypothetical protein